MYAGCTRPIHRAALAVAGLSAAGLVQAQFGTSVAAETDYRARGVSLSASRPTLHATVGYDAAGGWYLGATATRVEPARGDRYAQLVSYLGRGWELDPSRRVELGITRSHFTGESRNDYGEAYAGLLAEGWSARVFLAPNYFGQRVRTAYAEVNAHRRLDTRTRLFGHVGMLAPLGHSAAGTNQARADVRLGVAAAAGDLDLQIAWVAVSHHDGPYPAVGDGRRAAWVAGVSFAF